MTKFREILNRSLKMSVLFEGSQKSMSAEIIRETSAMQNLAEVFRWKGYWTTWSVTKTVTVDQLSAFVLEEILDSG